MQMNPLYGAMLKIERVKEQLDLLMTDFAAFLQDEAYSMRQEVDDETGEHVLFYDCGDLRPPLSWSVRVGEMLYDLRSSLDHFLWELVLHDGGKPGIHTEFPIIGKSETYHSTERGGGLYKLQGVKAKGRAFIDGLQPYHTRNDPKILHPLRVLHRLSIIDKHRYLNLTCGVVKLGKLKITPRGMAGGTVSGSMNFNVMDNVRLEGRAELARFRASGGGPDSSVEVEFPHTIEIAFDDAPIVRRRLVKEVIAVLTDNVERVLLNARRDLF